MLLPRLGPVGVVDDPRRQLADRAQAERLEVAERLRRLGDRPPRSPPRRPPAGRPGRSPAASASTRAPSPSSTSSNAGSTLVPTGATRPRISLTASTASTSAATESSSQAPARAGLAAGVRRLAGRQPSASRTLSRIPPPFADTGSPASAASSVSSSRWRFDSFVGHDDVDEHVEVAARARPAEVRHAAAAQPDLRPGLGARP